MHEIHGCSFTSCEIVPQTMRSFKTLCDALSDCHKMSCHPPFCQTGAVKPRVCMYSCHAFTKTALHFFAEATCHNASRLVSTEDSVLKPAQCTLKQRTRALTRNITLQSTMSRPSLPRKAWQGRFRRPHCAGRHWIRHAAIYQRPAIFADLIDRCRSRPLVSIDLKVSQLENTPAVPQYNFSFEILLVKPIGLPNRNLSTKVVGWNRTRVLDK